MCQPNHRSTWNKGFEHACYLVTQDHSEQYCTSRALSAGVRSLLNSDYIEQSLGSRYNVRHTTFILQTSFYAPFAVYRRI